MEITVIACDWGLARLEDVRKLLVDTASHIERCLTGPQQGRIEVLASPATDMSPRTLFRASQHEPFRIQLTAKDRRWSQFAYQFAHEFCHVLSGYEHLRNNPNNWLHEAICELASMFTLRRMANRWRSHPPYGNWSDDATHLLAYADDVIARAASQAPPESEFTAWLMAEEKALRRDPYLREKNAIVARRLLPAFEQQPNGWSAIMVLPSSTADSLAIFRIGKHRPISLTSHSCAISRKY